MRFSTFKEDFATYKNYSGRKAFLNINLYIVLFFRISHFFFKNKMFLFSRLFWLLNRVIFSVDIDPGANIRTLLIIHGIGIVIGREVEVSGSLKIYHGATLGGNMNKQRVINGKTISQPIIKNNVTVGINSAILGPVIIGNNVLIGTGAIVTKDVPDNSLVIGVNQISRYENN